MHCCCAGGRIDNQDMQFENARDMNVTVNFDGVQFPGAHFKTHGRTAASLHLQVDGYMYLMEIDAY